MTKLSGFRRSGKGAIFAAGAILLIGCELSAQVGTWTSKTAMPTARWGLCAGVVEGDLYVVGGAAGPAGISLSVVEAYDPRTDTWSTKTPIPTPRFWAGAAVANGILYVGGGLLQDAFGATILNTLEAYDPKTGTWSSRAPMPTARLGLALGVVDGIIYAVGGGNSSAGILMTVEAYNPRTDTWTSMTPMPTAREFVAVAVAGGRLYAVGGAGVGGPINPLGTVEAYDPGTNNWTTLPSMPTPRSGLAAGSIGGLIFAVGGQGDSRTGIYFPTLEVFDPRSNSWASAPRMSEMRAMLGVGVADDVLYSVGGIGEMRRIFSANEAFNPFLAVAIDIKPGDPDNTINLKSRGTVPVAILGSATFDPTTVDPATVTLPGAPVATRSNGVPMTSIVDADGDGYLDLLLHFRTQDLQLTRTSTEAVLYGETFSGQRIRGADAVRIVASDRLLRSNPWTEGPRARPARPAD